MRKIVVTTKRVKNGMGYEQNITSMTDVVGDPKKKKNAGYTYELRQASTTKEYAVVETRDDGSKHVVFTSMDLGEARKKLQYLEKQEAKFQKGPKDNPFSEEAVGKMVRSKKNEARQGQLAVTKDGKEVFIVELLPDGHALVQGRKDPSLVGSVSLASLKLKNGMHWSTTNIVPQLKSKERLEHPGDNRDLKFNGKQEAALEDAKSLLRSGGDRSRVFALLLDDHGLTRTAAAATLNKALKALGKKNAISEDTPVYKQILERAKSVIAKQPNISKDGLVKHLYTIFDQQASREELAKIVAKLGVKNETAPDAGFEKEPAIAERRGASADKKKARFAVGDIVKIETSRDPKDLGKKGQVVSIAPGTGDVTVELVGGKKKVFEEQDVVKNVKNESDTPAEDKWTAMTYAEREHCLEGSGIALSGDRSTIERLSVMSARQIQAKYPGIWKTVVSKKLRNSETTTDKNNAHSLDGFSVGDRVTLTGGTYKGEKGTVDGLWQEPNEVMARIKLASGREVDYSTRRLMKLVGTKNSDRPRPTDASFWNPKSQNSGAKIKVNSKTGGVLVEKNDTHFTQDIAKTQNMLSIWLKTLGMDAMASEVKTEKDPATLKRYAQIVMKELEKRPLANKYAARVRELLTTLQLLEAKPKNSTKIKVNSKTGEVKVHKNNRMSNPGKVDESLWSKAKAAAEKSGGGWGLVTDIYKKMGGTFK